MSSDTITTQRQQWHLAQPALSRQQLRALRQAWLARSDALPLPATPQPEAGVTYASKIDKAEARIDWTKPAAEVDRQIRGLSPFPGAWCDMGGERVKLLRSRLADGHGAPGEILHGLTMACGSGAVEITLAQREGKRPMTAADFLNGARLPDRLR